MIRQNLIKNNFFKKNYFSALFYNLNSHKNFTNNTKIFQFSRNIILNTNKTTKFQHIKIIQIFSKKSFSTQINKGNLYINYDYLQNDKNKFYNSNQEILNNLMIRLNSDDCNKISDNETFLQALSICNFIESEDFSKKCKKKLLQLFRYNNYEIFNTYKFNEDVFIDFFSNLYNLDLLEEDLKIIENKFSEFSEIFRVEQMVEIFEFLYFYKLNRYILEKIINYTEDFFIKSYLVLTPENNYIFNSNLIFLNATEEISKFSLLAAEKLIQFTNFDFMSKILSLDQRIIYLQPLPKIINEIKYSNNLPEKMKEKIKNNCFETLNKFLKNIPKGNSNESILYLLSNAYLYGNLNSQIFELYVEDFYRNLSKFEIENIIDLFFFILNVSRHEINITEARERLLNQLFIILSTSKLQPKVFLQVNKFNIYLNECRNKLNESFRIWLINKNGNKNNENEIDFKNSFNKIINLSIDVNPFPTKDLNYSEELIEELYISFKNIIKKI